MSDSNGKPPGPSQSTLKHLAEILPSFAKAVVAGEVKGKGRKIPVSRPRKLCPICLDAFDIGLSDKIIPEEENCERCQKLLDDNYTAFSDGNRFAFAKSARLGDWSGKVIRISKPVFDKLANTFEMEWETTEKKNDAAPES